MRIYNFGITQLPTDEPTRPKELESRLRLLEIIFLFLTIPAFYLELSSGVAHSTVLGQWFYGLAAVGTLATLFSLARLAPNPFRFVRGNWLTLLIALFAMANLMPTEVPWTAWEWFLRGGLAILGFYRLSLFFASLITPGSLPHVFLMALGLLAAAGLGFYWLEPSIHSYGEGLWLAFVSAATVGYGDFFPTTPASRVFAVFIVLLGYTVLSLVTASIAAMLVGEEEKRLRNEMRRDIREMRDEIKLLRNELLQARHEKLKK
jgi:voltage-gated potassium channel